MPVETLYLSGPAGSGKSTLACLLNQAVKKPAHLLRMRPAADGHSNLIVPKDPAKLAGGWKSVQKVYYTADRVFETLPEALRAIREREHHPFVVIEADADPSLRHAYPYDYRLFVMVPPKDLHEVFRDEAEAAMALREVMQDTASFASEIFGLLESGSPDEALDAQSAESSKYEEAENPQVGQFLNSPLGAEIAARIQLQPQYYALVESDVAIINTGLGRPVHLLDECIRRLDKLLAHVRHEARRHSVLYWGDLHNPADPLRTQLVNRVKILLGG